MDKTEKLRENCETAENCGKLRTSILPQKRQHAKDSTLCALRVVDPSLTAAYPRHDTSECHVFHYSMNAERTTTRAISNTMKKEAIASF